MFWSRVLLLGRLKRSFCIRPEVAWCRAFVEFGSLAEGSPRAFLTVRHRVSVASQSLIMSKPENEGRFGLFIIGKQMCRVPYSRAPPGGLIWKSGCGRGCVWGSGAFDAAQETSPRTTPTPIRASTIALLGAPLNAGHCTFACQ